MSNKQKSGIIVALNASLVIAGIASLIVGTSQSLQASTLPPTGQGTIATQIEVNEGHSLAQGTLHAAPLAEPNMAPLLVLGMLMILLGCSFHALLVIRNQTPTPVEVKRKINRKDLNPIRRYLEIFWVDLRK